MPAITLDSSELLSCLIPTTRVWKDSTVYSYALKMDPNGDYCRVPIDLGHRLEYLYKDSTLAIHIQHDEEAEVSVIWTHQAWMDSAQRHKLNNVKDIRDRDILMGKDARDSRFQNMARILHATLPNAPFMRFRECINSIAETNTREENFKAAIESFGRDFGVSLYIPPNEHEQKLLTIIPEHERIEFEYQSAAARATIESRQETEIEIINYDEGADATNTNQEVDDTEGERSAD